MGGQPLLTPEDVAERLALKRVKTAREIMRARDHVKLGKLLRWTEEQLAAFIEESTHHPGQTSRRRVGRAPEGRVGKHASTVDDGSWREKLRPVRPYRRKVQPSVPAKLPLLAGSESSSLPNLRSDRSRKSKTPAPTPVKPPEES